MLRISIPKRHIHDSIDELYMLIDSDMKEPFRDFLLRCYQRHPNFLETAYSMGFTILNYAVECNNTYAVERLLMNSIIRSKLEELDTDRHSPLTRAIQNEHTDILNLLIQQNVQISHAEMKQILQLKMLTPVRARVLDYCSLL